MVDFLFSQGPIEALQSLSPYLDWLFIAITTSGSGVFLVGLSLLIYWLWNKRAGFLLVTAVLFSGAINGTLKEVFQTSRPPVSLRLVEQGGYGFPSGHAQQSATFWSGVGLLYRKVWSLVAPILIFLVALSRVYLGVHYVGSVLGGVAIGLPVAVAAYFLQRATFWDGMNFRSRLLLAALWPALLVPLYAVGMDLAGIIGMLSGFSVGYVLEGRYVRLRPSKGIAPGVLRALLGFLPLGALYWWTMSVGDPLVLLFLHAALGLLAALVFPWIFLMVEGWMPAGGSS